MSPSANVNGLDLDVYGGGWTGKVQKDLLNVQELLRIPVSSSNISRDGVDLLLVSEEGVLFRTRPCGLSGLDRR